MHGTTVAEQSCKTCLARCGFVPLLRRIIFAEIQCFLRTKLLSAWGASLLMSSAPRDDPKINDPGSLSFEALQALPDEAVIAHLQAGHGDALGVLFDRYHRLVLHVALKILRDVGEAEDVMQSVFMEIYKVAAQFDPSRGTTKMWVLRYAYHRSMNRRKQLQIRHFYSNTDIAAIQDIMLTGETSIAASHEARELIQRGFQGLNPIQKRVLHLAYFEGLTMKEIAEEMGESLGNVRHHYYRGLDKLRDHLSQADRASEVRIARKEMGDAKA
jgi:RNA polymerase sigma-70 factor, ECF subfamily